MTPRAWLGLAFLVTSITGVTVAVSRAPGASTLVSRLSDHLTGRMAEISVRFPETPDLAPGDPVYTVDGESFALVGRVAAISTDGPTLVRLEVDPMIRRSLGARTRAEAMSPDQDLAWILRTLVPPPLRKQVIAELREVWMRERHTTYDELKPALMELLKDLASVLAETLPDVIEKNRAELTELFAMIRQDIYPEHLRPVVKETWVPLLEARLMGTAADIGSEVARKVKWSHVAALVFSSIMKDVGLASEKDVKKRLERLLEKAALPVLRKKVPELARGAYEATAETLETEEVQVAIRQAFERLLKHPDFGALLGRMNRDWLMKNERLNQRLRSAMRDPKFKKIGEKLWKQMEPTLERTLQTVLTRPQGEGMNHQLVRVLRRVVLKKDKRYILLVPGEGAPLKSGRSVLVGSIGRDF